MSFWGGLRPVALRWVALLLLLGEAVVETPDLPEAIRPRPDYPPKTPPPPKKPPSPPPPQALVPLAGGAPVRLDASRRLRVMANRPGGNWQFEAAPWAPKKAVAAVVERLAEWKLRAPEGLDEVVLFLVASVVPDGGRHVSVHLGEQDGQLLVLALSHRPDLAELGEVPLLRLRELGAVSCGTHVSEEGRQVWAVLDLAA